MNGAIAAIVEGKGEVLAVPRLLHRILRERCGRHDVRVRPPYRLDRGHMTRADRHQIAARIMALRLAAFDGDRLLLVLFDADDDCAATIAPHLRRSLLTVVVDGAGLRTDVSVVLAVREYEAWFLAASESLGGPAVSDTEIERIRDCKGFVRRRLPKRGNDYSETVDQAEMTARMDFGQAERSASFRKLLRDIARTFAAGS